jgi:hypothetical protein
LSIPDVCLTKQNLHLDLHKSASGLEGKVSNTILKKDAESHRSKSSGRRDVEHLKVATQHVFSQTGNSLQRVMVDSPRLKWMDNLNKFGSDEFDPKLAYDSLGLAAVRSWHLLDKVHCHAALMSLKSCERSTCYAQCVRSQRGSSLVHQEWTHYCAAQWDVSYGEALSDVQERAIAELVKYGISKNDSLRWWQRAVSTIEPCRPCAEDFKCPSIPKACTEEYSLYTMVWLDSLPSTQGQSLPSSDMEWFIAHPFVIILLSIIVIAPVLLCLLVPKKPRQSGKQVKD